MDATSPFPLHDAAEAGDLSRVQALVMVGADVEAKKTWRADVGLFDPFDEDCTPLHFAARNGHVEVVRYFVVACGANKESCSTFGDTPLCIAAHEGYLVVTRLLVVHGEN